MLALVVAALVAGIVVDVFGFAIIGGGGDEDVDEEGNVVAVVD